MSNLQPSRRLLAIGLDAVTFDLAKPWAQEGRLPHWVLSIDHA